MPNGEPTLTLYVRDGCHLCEDAGVLLDDMVGPDSYTAVDIEADDDLLARYGHRIPVLAVNGVDRLEAPISRPGLEGLLRSATRR